MLCFGFEFPFQEKISDSPIRILKEIFLPPFNEIEMDEWIREDSACIETNEKTAVNQINANNIINN